MPDFDARFTAGVTLKLWEDPPVPGGAIRPPSGLPGDLGNPPGDPRFGETYLPGLMVSRLNPRPGYPHKRWAGSLNAPITFKATVNGVEGELDANLDGRLFYTWPIEWPDGSGVPNFAAPAGQTSVRSFTPRAVGHYAFGFGRHGGGHIILHVDADANPS